MRKRRVALFALAFLCSATPAFAHSAFGTMGPFWSGALHLVVSPLALVSIAGLAASLAPIPRGESALEIMIAIAATALGGWLLADWSRFAAFGAVLTGSLAASGLKAARPAMLPLSAVAGIAIGAAAAIDAPGPTAGIGAAIACFLVMGFALAAFQELEPRLPLARRIVGAWVTAIGLLLVALAIAGRHT